MACVLQSAGAPVMSTARYSVTLYRFVTLVGSTRRSGTFFCVTNTTLSLPRTATLVRPEVVCAHLIAYSTWYSFPAGEKIVMWWSNLRGRRGFPTDPRNASTRPLSRLMVLLRASVGGRRAREVRLEIGPSMENI